MTTAPHVAPASASEAPAFDVTRAYRQSADIGLRPEPFGALAYHFVTRRLVFLKSNELVVLVEALADHSSASHAIDAVIHPESAIRRTTYEKALASLLESGVIEPGTASAPTDHQPGESI